MAATGSPELLIVMDKGSTQAQVEEVVARLAEAGAHARVSSGRDGTVIGAIGERALLSSLPLEGFPGVEQVLPILKPYKLVSRELTAHPTVVEVRGRRIGGGWFGLIAGPCAVEYREQTLEAARAVAAAGGDDAARRRLQAAHLALCLPGARRRGARDPRRGARGDGAADRDRADGRAPGRAGRRRDAT